MSATQETGARRRSDLRSSSRLLAAILLPVGPACIALLRYLLPYLTAGDSHDSIDAIAAHPDRQSACVWLGLVALLTLVPAVLAVGRLTRRGAPRLTAAAMLLLVPGYLMVGLIVSADAVAWYGVHEGVDREVMADLFAHGHPATYVAGALFVAGHVLGTVLLGLAMWHSAAVPRWVAVVTVIAQPLHFVAAVIVGSPTLDLLAWGMNAVAFAACSVAILRLRDDEWDLAPAAG
jgi:hypothetical protein